MGSRASYYHSVNKHAQRQGVAKPKPIPRNSDTAWIGEFLSSIQGTSHFGVNSIIALQLGATPEARMLKLRQASRFGILRMFMYRAPGATETEYRWELTAEGTLQGALPAAPLPKP